LPSSSRLLRFRVGLCGEGEHRELGVGDECHHLEGEFEIAGERVVKALAEGVVKSGPVLGGSRRERVGKSARTRRKSIDEKEREALDPVHRSARTGARNPGAD
jgi:hypothetical protein